ncbi:hypothetical protein [Photorhabdus viridis]|uniref:hypothetical protein n=1 Tax=Photorhabdus viridis TaxID=3163327 RepID=UPI0033072CBD
MLLGFCRNSCVMWFIKISYFKAFNIYFPNCLVELFYFDIYLKVDFDNKIILNRLTNRIAMHFGIEAYPANPSVVHPHGYYKRKQI